jgi:hypothetical protein
MIPTLPGTGDIPTGPERPQPTWAPPPVVARGRSDEFEALKKMVHELQAKVESLEARIAKLETGFRTV